MIGGTGNDTLELNLSSIKTAVTFRPIDQATATVTLAPNTTIQGFEHFFVTLGSGKDTIDLRGFSLSNTFTAGDASQSSQSFLDGGAGNNKLVVDAASRGTVELARVQTLEADLSALTTAADISSDYVHFDGFRASGPNYHNSFTAMVVTGGSANDIISGGVGIDTLRGRGGNDRLTGSEGDTLDGGSGDDYVVGAVGATMIGGTGNDTLELNLSSIKTAVTFRPIDQATATVTLAPNTAIQGFEHFFVTLGSGKDTIDLRGFSLSNTFTAGDASQSSQSFLDGGAGNNKLVVDAASRGTVEVYRVQKLEADLSALTTAADISSNHIYFDGFQASGLSSNNSFTAMVVTGGSVNDTISGSNGADYLNGGAGSDVLTGDLGRDIFAFTTALGASNIDHITDFTKKSDKINLSNTIFKTLPAGILSEDAFKNIELFPGKLDETDRILYNHKTGVLSYDADGNGKLAAINFLVIDNNLKNLSFNDILIV
ncbi:hypothetical protein AIGOOFII_3806 [Methylobacterium marchantiae]|nr:hypothetical protein AIGOOFII_3806 [Methylobacterium marchantiae]